MVMKRNTRKLAVLAFIAALMIIVAMTPLGYLAIGPVGISFNTIPVTIGAITLGPACGAILGIIFGFTSFLFSTSPIIQIMRSLNLLLGGLVCFLPRILEGILAGYISRGFGKTKIPKPVTYGATGLITAFFNTVLFAAGVLLVFGNSQEIMEMWTELAPDRNALVFICALTGTAAVIEWSATALVTSAVCSALYKSKLLRGI